MNFGLREPVGGGVHELRIKRASRREVFMNFGLREPVGGGCS